MVPDSAAPCHVDFLLVPHYNLAEVRLPSDVVPGTASITETVAYNVLTFDVFSCMCGSASDERRTWEPGARIQPSRFQLVLTTSVAVSSFTSRRPPRYCIFVNPSLSWGVVKVVAFGLASHAEDL